MKILTKYQCDICRTDYDIEKLAIDCETKHPEISSFKLDQVGYSIDRNNDFGENYTVARRLPKSIKIKITDGSEDYGIYELKKHRIS